MKYKYCFNCGKEIRASAKFCPHCGAKQDNKINNVTEPLETREERQHKRPNYKSLGNNNVHQGSRSLFKPLSQRVKLIVIPMMIIICYLIEFSATIEFATGGNSSSDQGAGTMGTFPISSRFGMIFLSFLPFLVSFFLSCNSRLWVQIISICLEMFGISEAFTYTQQTEDISIYTIAIILIALLVFSRVNTEVLFGKHFDTCYKTKIWISRILVGLAVLIIFMSLDAFYLLLLPMLVVVGIFIVLGILSRFVPSLKLVFEDGLGILHIIF